mgnify:CR=1 FL=1
MTQACIGHVDQRAVIGFQHQANVELGHAVIADQDPVPAAAAYGAFQVRAFECAAEHPGDLAFAEGRVAEQLQRGLDLEGDVEEMFCLDMAHGPVLP